MTTTCYDIMDEVYVMLDDHVKDNATKMIDLLKSCDYEGRVSTNLYIELFLVFLFK